MQKRCLHDYHGNLLLSILLMKHCIFQKHKPLLSGNPMHRLSFCNNPDIGVFIKI